MALPVYILINSVGGFLFSTLSLAYIICRIFFEREKKFIKVGDAVRTAAAQGKNDVEQGSLGHFYTQGARSAIGVLQVT